MFSKFVDYTKIGIEVDSEEGYLRLHMELKWKGQCAKEWQMQFISDKCEVLCSGKSKQGKTCSQSQIASLTYV